MNFYTSFSFFHLSFLKRLDEYLCVFVREAMGVVLHKDSKWYQQWKDFKDNNMVFNRKKQLSSCCLSLVVSEGAILQFVLSEKHLCYVLCLCCRVL